MARGNCFEPLRHLACVAILFWASFSPAAGDSSYQKALGPLKQLITRAEGETSKIPRFGRALFEQHQWRQKSSVRENSGAGAVSQQTRLLDESVVESEVVTSTQQSPSVKVSEQDKSFALRVLSICILFIIGSIVLQKLNDRKSQDSGTSSSPQNESENQAQLEQKPLLSATTTNATCFPVIAALPCLVDGLHFSIASGVVLKLDPNRQWSLVMHAFVVGSFQLGQVVCTFIVPSVIRSVGLKRTLQIIASGQALAALSLFLAPQSEEMLISARLLCGLCFGQSAAPAYIAEVTPVEQRGAAVSWVEIMTNFGSLLAMILTVVLWDSPVRYLWLCLLVGSVTVTLSLILLPRVVENQTELAPSSSSSTQQQVEVQDVWPKTRAAKKGLFISCVLAALQQSTGEEALYGYTAQIASDSGLARPLNFGIILAALTLPCNIVSGRVVDLAGRRPLLIGGLIGMAAAWAVASVGLMNKVGPQMVLGAVLTYELIFALTLGPGFFVVASEVLPASYRARGLSIALLVSRVVACLFVLTFELKNYLLSMEGTFLLYSLLMLGGAVFVGFQLPETACKSFDEIQDGLD